MPDALEQASQQKPLGVIRPAARADLDNLVALETDFPSDRLSRRNLRHLLNRGHADLLVYEERGMLLGDAIILYRRASSCARLYSLAVHPAQRRRGIANALLSAAEHSAAKRGSREIRLELRADNLAALHLYQYRGYRLIGHQDGYYEDGTRALRMRKSLVSSPIPERMPKLFP